MNAFYGHNATVESEHNLWGGGVSSQMVKRFARRPKGVGADCLPSDKN